MYVNAMLHLVCTGVGVAAVGWYCGRTHARELTGLRLDLLPREVQLRILSHAIAPPEALGLDGSLKLLLLSRACYPVLVREVYHTLYLDTQDRLNKVRHTLAKSPWLGTLVRTLVLVDVTTTSALGLEQLLLMLPHLRSLVLDESSTLALCHSTVPRLCCGPRVESVQLSVHSDEAAMDVGGTLLACPLLAHTTFLQVRAPSAAALVLVKRAETHPMALRRMAVHLAPPDADGAHGEGIHAALQALGSRRLVATSVHSPSGS